MCMGRGQVPSERCPTCSGSGEVRARKKLMVQVPTGIDSGAKIRLKGQGGRGAGGGAPGDLLITFQVQPDRFYKREGLDLIAELPLNVAQATLGSKVRVSTLDDKRVTIRIPPGTSAGKRFRIRGQGIQRDERRGDLIVQTTIVAPDALSEEQQRLMKEFADSAGLKY
jgi:molecular chaperone DnaJ